MPYAKKLLGTAESVAYNKPYETFGGQRVAGLNPLQQQAMNQIQQQQVASQIGQATGFAGLAGLEAQKAGKYTPGQFQELGISSFADVNAPQLKDIQMGPAERVAAQQLEQYQMGPARDVQAERFGVSSLQPYMSPYMQDVVELQKQKSIEDYARQIPGLQAAGVRSGARGGTREAILQSEARRGLRGQLADIQATGTQRAFEQAQQQYGADRAAALQAQLANQAAGLTVGQQNLAARLGVQQLGAQQGLQAALANQAAGLTTGQANLQAALQTQGLGAQTGMQAQLANQQARLAAQQAALQQRQFGSQFGEQSRQFGANLGMQGVQQQLAAAGMLGNLGQQQFGQQQAINQAQMGAGQQLQQMEQARLQAQYEDFLARQRYPYAQLGFMSDLIRGTPTAGGIQTMYQAGPNPLSTVAGLGALAYGGTR
jgi:hypothetical protein